MANHDQNRRTEIEAKHPTMSSIIDKDIGNWINYLYEDMRNTIIGRTTWRQLAQEILECQGTSFGALKYKNNDELVSSQRWAQPWARLTGLLQIQLESPFQLPYYFNFKQWSNTWWKFIHYVSYYIWLFH